eukprot:CAMPEP_0206262444 /NCGR_PEP_ID=MMETSP0047_2-20121206/28237_1 /ASSEMBLY_ACC=CAM_ASM_000192 /TAXON_ID=195065 /ORGANISM="Chroomonas mesostigmatica_cf, Strain CCMP1168" /LENGTH=95 /DNA_ID=CAMNT_0053689817 /DNA_START=79 /DNA_END=363 /DNA_ORIENTATION=+
MLTARFTMLLLCVAMASAFVAIPAGRPAHFGTMGCSLCPQTSGSGAGSRLGLMPQEPGPSAATSSVARPALLPALSGRVRPERFALFMAEGAGAG